MKDLYLLLGSNVGRRMAHLGLALKLLEEKLGRSTRKSALYESEPWGRKDQGKFINQAVAFETDLDSLTILRICQAVEDQVGKKASVKWGPREIDIDILLLGNEVSENEDLTVPHERLTERRFALAPLHEIAPDLMHPVLQRSINDLLEACADESTVYPVNATNEV